MKQQGFTLIEILIVILILGIVSSVAIYNYQSYLLRANRADAIKLLLDTAASEENYYSFKYKYTDVLSDLGMASDTSAYGHYRLSVDLIDNKKSFILTATPIGKQVSDSCGAFKLHSDGERTADKNGCWK